MRTNINILNELKEAGSTVLINADKENYYFVPTDYFNAFAGNLLSRIFIESIPPVNIYTVPYGYFNQLDPFKVELEKPAAKVIPIGGRVRKWVTYAAAACIAVLFGGGFLYLFHNPVNNTAPIAQLVGVDVQKGISTLSDDE